MLYENQDKKNKKIGMAVSIGAHMAIFILFFFLMAWREPNPPHPEYGIELNFGLDNVGSGEIQKETPPNKSDNTEQDAKPEPPSSSEPVEQKVAESAVKPAETQEAEVITSNVESPVKVEESKTAKAEVKPTPKETTQTKVEKTTTKEENTAKAETKVVNKDSKTSGADGKAGESTSAVASNHGDNKDKVGDKGDEKGKLDDKSLYGKPGGGGGAALDMAGWTWDSKPKPDDNSSESGRIVFEIVIDDQGEIISVKTLEKTVSPAIEKIYRQEVERLTFSKTAENTRSAARSSGKITFIIKSK
jgi:periplasmic protein TonB